MHVPDAMHALKAAGAPDGGSRAKGTGLAMGVMRKLGQVAGRAAMAAAPQVGRKVADVARSVAPTSGELVSAGEKVVENLRERNPELMAKVSSTAAKVVGKAGEYLPGVVERATRMVDDARGGAPGSGAARDAGAAGSGRSSSAPRDAPDPTRGSRG